MCGRFSLQTPIDQLVKFFDGLPFPNDYHPQKQIAPTQQVMCIRENDSNQLEAVWMQWGLIPSWAKDAKIGSKMINARSETVDSKPAFRAAFRKRRCLILADAFYEWKKQDSAKQAYPKQAYRIYPTVGDSPIFCFAGLWESWYPPENHSATSASTSSVQLELFCGQPFESPNSTEPSDRIEMHPEKTRLTETCTILTTAANNKISHLHDRMPVILNGDQHRIWLDHQNSSLSTLRPLYQPVADSMIDFQPIQL